MNERFISLIFLLLCLLLCISLPIGTIVFGPSRPSANEILAPVPRVIGSNGTLNDDFGHQIANYFNDHHFFRQQMITGYAAAIDNLFGTSARQDILLGRDGWLFFGSTLADFTDSKPMSERELHACASNLKLMQEACENNGTHFLFVCAPNKNSIYPKQMPSFAKRGSENSANRLYHELNENNTAYVRLDSVLSQKSDQLYFAHDSHWNSRGAALAADCILQSIGKNSDYYAGPFSAPVLHTGDLYEMLYPALIDTEADTPAENLSYTFVPQSGTRPDSIHIYTESPGNGNLLMYRDSFGNLLYPFLADSFRSAHFSRSVNYDLSALSDTDVVIIELVERNLRWLMKNIPVMKAPKRAFPDGQFCGSTLLVATSSGMEGYTLYRGTTERADPTSPVLLTSSSEAFDCFLLEDDGFAAYIPSDTEITAVAYLKGRTWVLSEAILEISDPI